MKTIAIRKEDAEHLFKDVEKEFGKLNKKARIIVVGGMAIILQGIRQRATLDIDVAPTEDATLFREICAKLNIPVDIITIASTVDLVYAPTITVYSGNHLTIDSVTPENLIKLKLERFFKQDPEDIYAIIDYLSMTYDVFRNLVRDMLVDFIGNPRSLILSALQVAEIKYPDCAKTFEAEISKSQYGP